MATSLACTRCRGQKSAAHHGVFQFKRALQLVFFVGPKILITSRISGKCAFIMLMMSLPSLLCCFLLTVPGMIFQSPQQHAYFYFSRVLNEDPARWVVLGLAAFSTLLSLAIPATLPDAQVPPDDK